VETALGRLLQQAVPVRAAGRTDAGVHALRQWATFSARTRLALGDLLRGLNALLPGAIRVGEVAETSRAVNALQDSRRKTYCYNLRVGSVLPPHQRTTAVLVPSPLDLDAMRRAAELLVGTHDFTSFATEANRRRSCVRELSRVRVFTARRGVLLVCTGAGFLYNMVRTIAAVLIEVGQGRRPPHWVGEVLAGRDRSAAPQAAPPQGLFLVRADWRPAVEQLVIGRHRAAGFRRAAPRAGRQAPAFEGLPGPGRVGRPGGAEAGPSTPRQGAPAGAGGRGAEGGLGSPRSDRVPSGLRYGAFEIRRSLPAQARRVSFS
jgi:tRNA pseudouridine38-40 synthase